MKAPLEEFVPYDRSVRWRVQDAYYRNRGPAAWSIDEIPHFATCNYAIARQHAQLVARVARELTEAGALGPWEQVYVLEMGSGAGDFAPQLFRALEDGAGADGAALASRLRYVLSDYVESTVAGAARSRALKPLVAADRVIPALFDIRAPERILDLKGRPLAVKPAAAVASYVCDVSPTKLIRKTKEGFFEQWAQARVELPEERASEAADRERLLESLLDRAIHPGLLKEIDLATEWREVDLDALLPSRDHADALREALAGFDEATLSYPFVFFDLVARLRALVKPGGLFLVNDFGTCELQDLKGLTSPQALFYGNSLSHGVPFALLEAFCRKVGLSVARTRKPQRLLQTAAVRYSSELAPAFRAEFESLYVGSEDGEDLVDFRTAAYERAKAGDYRGAARFWERCLRLDPSAPEFLYGAGTACIEGGLYEAAAGYLTRGRKEDEGGALNFDFQLGRATYLLGRLDDAVAWYLKALDRERDATTLTNLGAIHQEKKEWKEAYRSYRAALDLDPAYDRAKGYLEELKTRWFESELA